MATFFYENGLNVSYVSNFIEKTKADVFFEQLKILPFYTPTFKIWGKDVMPKRQMLAYGDAGLSYAFSGTQVAAQPWTPLMTELRNLVEKHVGCAYNYVLLNLYSDGQSYISQHKDNENSLDDTFPIAVLSFGSPRKIEFKKPNTPSTIINLEHGSLYTMGKPTNELFTHGIAPDPSIKGMRISLTFRHLIPNPIMPPLKKPRLVISDASFSVCDTSKNSLINDCDTSKNSSFSDCDTSIDNCSQVMCKELNPNSWLNQCLREQSTGSIYAEWNLKLRTFLQIVIENNQKLRIRIHNFKELPTGEWIPTREGIVMTAQTWYYFQHLIENFNFKSVSDSFISNNQLLMLCINENWCILQQMFPLSTCGFYLKPNVIKLSKEQILILRELKIKITDSIIDAIFTIQLPMLIMNKSPFCLYHVNEENAKGIFLKSIAHEVRLCIEDLFHCDECLFNSSGQSSLDYSTIPLLAKFQLNRDEILLKLNLYAIVQSITCTCHYNISFFKELNMKLYEKYIEDALYKL